MEVYPSSLTARYDPLCVLSGISPGPSVPEDNANPQQQGLKVGPTSARLSGEQSQSIIKAFQALEGANADFDIAAQTGQHRPVSFIVAPGQYAFPARKASPQAQLSESPSERGPPLSSGSNTVLYSPLSPLAAGSPLHPDGLVTPLWNSKYQNLVPCVFISFFELSADPNLDSLRDNQLKNDITTISQILQASKFRTRHAVVLIGSDMLSRSTPQLEDRINTIRRGAHLDESMIHFLSAGRSFEEIGTFAAAVISAMRPQMIEFYRDATRHTRRKRDKGGNPTPQGRNNAGAGLSRMAWISRYEYKLGVFAEFRGEMDVAERHYVASLNALFDHQGPFEATSSWSPRWNEARIWSDTMSIRLIRCQLFVNAPTLAVRSWALQRNRTRSLLNRNGKGIANYSWHAWMSRWTRIMADLVYEQPAGLDSPDSDNVNDGQSNAAPVLRTFAEPERFVAQELNTIPAWEHMHHPGYWLMVSAAHGRQRRQLATEIPEEDRIPPGQSPASSVVRRSEFYDTYLCLEPHQEYRASQQLDGVQTIDVVSALSQAVTGFTDREQPRFADRARIELAEEWRRMEKSNDATKLLHIILKETYWRSERWFRLLWKLCSTLRDCASIPALVDIRLSSVLELHGLSRVSSVTKSQTPNNTESRPQSPSQTAAASSPIKISAADIIPWFDLSLCFMDTKSNVGEPLKVQLVLQTIGSENMSLSKTLKKLQLEFNGGIRTVLIEHSDDNGHEQCTFTSEKVHWQVLDTSDDRRRSSSGTGNQSVTIKADLTVSAKQSSILEITLFPISAGPAAATQAVASFDLEDHQIDLIIPLNNRLDTPCQWLLPCAPYQTTEKLRVRKKLLPEWGFNIHVLPRPPKLEIVVIGLPHVIYSDEKVYARIHMVNKEEDDTDVQLRAQAMEDAESRPLIEWINPDKDYEDADEAEKKSKDDAASNGILPLRRIPETLTQGNAWDEEFLLQSSADQTDMSLEIEARYTLTNQPENIMSKNVAVDFAVICAFDVEHHVKVDYHPHDWPSYFAISENDEDETDDDNKSNEQHETQTAGLSTRWHSKVTIKSAAVEPLSVSKVQFKFLSVGQNAIQHSIESGPQDDASFERTLKPKEEADIFNCFNLTKTSLDERRSVVLEPAVEIHWRRAHASADSPTNITIMPLPHLSLAGSEPRVLARQLSTESDAEAIIVEVVMENPSMHFLTFETTLESLDDFAFSGPRTATTSLLPVSRRAIQFVLLPLRDVDVIRLPLRVVDVYFNKTLVVHAVEPLRNEANLIHVPLSKVSRG